MGVGHELLEVAPFERIEAAERVVEQEHVRVVHDGPGDEQPLGVPLVERVKRLVAAIREPRQRDGPGHRILQAVTAESACRGEELHELLHADARPGRHASRHIADHPPHGLRLAANGMTVDEDLAGMQRQGRRGRGEE